MRFPTMMICVASALGFALAACASAPGTDPQGTETDPAAAAQGNGEHAGEEQTGATGEALMKGGLGETCGTTCSSDDKRQSCCCGVDKRCVTSPGTCKCEAASIMGGGGGLEHSYIP